mmetsp:Transcript_1012/g.2629  ORF Transcript_1012/g.2629 Transcript_1012/m.2629 type:complete len:260 (-) Transcript_1012:125-904(-)
MAGAQWSQMCFIRASVGTRAASRSLPSPNSFSLLKQNTMSVATWCSVFFRASASVHEARRVTCSRKASHRPLRSLADTHGSLSCSKDHRHHRSWSWMLRHTSSSTRSSRQRSMPFSSRPVSTPCRAPSFPISFPPRCCRRKARVSADARANTSSSSGSLGSHCSDPRRASAAASTFSRLSATMSWNTSSHRSRRSPAAVSTARTTALMHWSNSAGLEDLKKVSLSARRSFSNWASWRFKENTSSLSSVMMDARVAIRSG